MISGEDREELLRAIETRGPEALKDAGNSLKTDLNMLLTAVKQNGMVLEYVDDSFKANRELVLQAVD